MHARVRGAAVLWPGPVVIVGPSGAGKTGVLLAAVARGAVPVDGEEVVVSDGEVRAATGQLRLRARHLRQSPGACARLGRLDRARLQAGAALASVPRVGRRLGRRVFVDAPLDAIGPTADAATGDVAFVVLVPAAAAPLDPVQLTGTDAVDALRPHLVAGDPSGLGTARVWRLSRHPDEGDAELAQRLGRLVAAVPKAAG